YGEEDLRLVVSGPLTETLSARVALLNRTSDGYFENTTLGRDEAQEEERVIRGTLAWKPTDNWNITLKVEDGSFDSDGRNIEVVRPVELPVDGAVPYANVLSALTGARIRWILSRISNVSPMATSATTTLKTQR